MSESSTPVAGRPVVVRATPTSRPPHRQIALATFRLNGSAGELFDRLHADPSAAESLHRLAETAEQDLLRLTGLIHRLEQHHG